MAKPVVQEILSGNVRLRVLTAKDLSLTLTWRNQAVIRRWFIYSEPITQEQHEDWYAKYCQRDNDLVFIIEEVGDLNRPVGQVSLYDIDEETGRAEFGRLMIGDEEARGRGLAKKATMLILDFGFKACSLEEIYLEVFEDNQAAIHIYQQLGFVCVGRREKLLKMALHNPYLSK